MRVFSAFKDALIDYLLAQSAVAAIVGERIYDEAPQDAPGDPADADYPYVYLGPIGAQRIENVSDPEWMIRIRVYVASNAFGRNEAWALLAALYTALEGATLTLPSGMFMSPPIWILQGGDVIDPINPKMAFLDLTTIVAG